MNLSEAVQTYLSHMKARSLSLLSVETAHYHLRAFVRYHGETWPTYPDLVRWQSSLVGSRTTAHHKARTLRTFFAWCVKMQYITASPAADLDVPKRPRKLPEFLTPEQLHTILDWTPSYERDYECERLATRDRAIVRLLMYTGLRRAELCALTVGDVNLRVRALVVRGGKGDRDRTVPLPDALDLEPLLRGRGAQRPLFEGTYGRRRMAPDAISYMFTRKLSRDVGFRVTPHLLRHSYATFLCRKGIPVRQIQELLGHSSLATTQVYLSVTADDLRSAVAVLNTL